MVENREVVTLQRIRKREFFITSSLSRRGPTATGRIQRETNRERAGIIDTGAVSVGTEKRSSLSVKKHYFSSLGQLLHLCIADLQQRSDMFITNHHQVLLSSSPASATAETKRRVGVL
jgi:hypothetical protein